MVSAFSPSCSAVAAVGGARVGRIPKTFLIKPASHLTSQLRMARNWFDPELCDQAYGSHSLVQKLEWLTLAVEPTECTTVDPPSKVVKTSSAGLLLASQAPASPWQSNRKSTRKDSSWQCTQSIPRHRLRASRRRRLGHYHGNSVRNGVVTG